jgi:hypothetical protein
LTAEVNAMVPEKRDDRGAANGLDVVDESSVESFPASDPPSWVPGTAGPPSHGKTAEPERKPAPPAAPAAPRSPRR